MKNNEALKNGELVLLKENIDEARLKAKLLLFHILDISKEKYALIQDEKINKENLSKFYEGIKKISKGEPLEYVIGKAYFLEYEYIVNKSVLIPRLETELLVIKALDLIKNNNIKRVLEIGTGSGIIGIHLVKNSNIELVAVDISEEALQIAKLNAERLKVDFDRYKLIKSDVYENISGEFDLIISNPPYIKTEEIKDLNKDVLNEPITALDGGIDGLEIYSKIIKDSFKYLNNNGFLIFEIGATLGDGIIKILEENNCTENKVFKDLSGLDRIILSKR